MRGKACIKDPWILNNGGVLVGHAGNSGRFALQLIFQIIAQAFYSSPGRNPVQEAKRVAVNGFRALGLEL